MARLADLGPFLTSSRLVEHLAIGIRTEQAVERAETLGFIEGTRVDGATSYLADGI